MKHLPTFVAVLAVAFAAGVTAANAQRVHPTGPSIMMRNPSPPGMMMPQPDPTPPPLAEAPHSGIAAVVNDNVISTSDLNSRIAMAFLSSGLPDTLEVRAHLLVQLLHLMIDEQLEMQEAKKLDITVSPTDINDALDKIAHDNNIPGGDIKAFLASRGIPPSALVNQIKAGLSPEPGDRPRATPACRRW